MNEQPMRKDVKALLILISLFVCLQVADIVTTAVGLQLDGLREGNSYLRHFNVNGVSWLDVLAKVVITFLLSAVIYKTYKYAITDDSPICEILLFFTLIVVNTYYVYVVATNTLLLL